MDKDSVLKLEEIGRRSQELEEQIKIVEQQISELESFSEGLKDFNNYEGKEILAAVGKGVFVPSEIKEKRFFVEVGAGILTEKSPEEVGSVAEEQIKKLNKIKMQLNYEIGFLNLEMKEFISKLRK